MEKKLLLIYNPVSGKAQIKTYLADIIDIYAGKDYSVTVHPTKCALDGFEYIKAHGTEYDIISVCGGDGGWDHDREHRALHGSVFSLVGRGASCVD